MINKDTVIDHLEKINKIMLQIPSYDNTKTRFLSFPEKVWRDQPFIHFNDLRFEVARKSKDGFLGYSTYFGANCFIDKFPDIL